MSDTLSDSDLTKEFKKRFDHALPLQHIDLVMVKGLELKEEKQEVDE